MAASSKESFCGKQYMIRTFYRQYLHLLLTFIETTILFLKSCNFVIWSRIRLKFFFDNYTCNELLSNSKAESLNLVVESVTALWLTAPVSRTGIRSMHSRRNSGSQPRRLPWNETSRHIYYQFQNSSLEPFKSTPPQGAPSTFLLTVSMSVTCTPTNKQIQKRMHVTHHPSSSLWGLAYSESKAEEVTKSFEGYNQVL